MNELFKTLLENIKKWGAFEYFLVLTTAFVISVGSFFLIHWIYQARFDAWEGLVKIKNQTIEALEKENTQLKKAKTDTIDCL